MDELSIGLLEGRGVCQEIFYPLTVAVKTASLAPPESDIHERK
jgi:hypothetical protein